MKGRKSDRHKKVICIKCFKEFRSNYVNRHMLVHLRREGAPEKASKRLCKESIADAGEFSTFEESIDFAVKGVLNILVKSVEQTTPDNAPSTEKVIMNKTTGIEAELIHDSDIFDENVQLGGKISDIITTGRVKEESLSKKNKYCLELFRKHSVIINVKDVVLKPWQKMLMGAIEKPDFRTVIWILGPNGNEGKSWFQNYVESLYGYERVARFDFKSRAQDVLHALSKRPLASTDIFLFNIPRSTDAVAFGCYSVLESIKDGVAVSSKYDSKPIRFKTPNVLIVFSNEPPEPKQLSKDRWCIKGIKKGETMVSISPEQIVYNNVKQKYYIRRNMDNE